MPSFSITRRDLMLAGTVVATISFRPNDLNAHPMTACAPSVASPCPQCSAARRQPIETTAAGKVESIANQADAHTAWFLFTRSVSAEDIIVCSEALHYR